MIAMINPWATEGSIDLLRLLWTRGDSAAECSAALRSQLGVYVSRNACIGKARRLNLERRGPQVSSRPVTVPKNNPRSTRSRIARARRNDPGLEPDPVVEPLSESCPDVTIMTVGMDQCRWPLGEPAHDMPMCGAKVEYFGCPYCRRHARIAFNPAPRS